MWKITTTIILIIVFIVYSAFVYSSGTAIENKPSGPEMLKIKEGKQLFQKNNCMACHQFYGLGGYLGPDLTDVVQRYPDSAYIRAMLTVGNKIMPAYNFSTQEQDAFIAYFNYISQHAKN